MAPDGNTDTNISSSNSALDDGNIPAHLAQFTEFYLIDNSHLDFREYATLSDDEKLSLPVETILQHQKWHHCSQENRDDGHLLSCEIALAAIGSAGFDNLLEAVDETVVKQPDTSIN